MNKKINIIDDSIMGETFDAWVEDDYNISIHLMNGKLLSDVLNDKDTFIKDMKQSLEIRELYMNDLEEDTYELTLKAWNYYKDNFEHILDLADFICINVSEPKKFIEENPTIKNKNLVLNEFVGISEYERVSELSKEYLEYPNIYITLQGNTGYVKLDECKKIMDVIKEYSDHIKSLNLSPLEQVMYAYDIVRDRTYEDDETDYHISRDLQNVLFNKAIVCVGYARILGCILDNLGIKNELVGMTKKDDEVGHLRNAVYVNDSKYNVKGYYYLDATWDSKRNDTNNYLLRYKYFLKTRDEMEKLESYAFDYAGTECYSKNLKEDIKDAFQTNDFLSFLKMSNKINRLYRMALNVETYVINPSDVIKHSMDFREYYDLNKILNKIDKMQKSLNKTIDAETYIKLVSNVRKIEYYLEPTKYPYSLDTIYSIYVNSGWEFSRKHYNQNELRLATLFGIDKAKLYKPEKDFANYVCFDTKIVNEPSSVVLAKTLRKVLGKKM